MFLVKFLIYVTILCKNSIILHSEFNVNEILQNYLALNIKNIVKIPSYSTVDGSKLLK